MNLADANLRWVLLGTMLLGLAAGVLGAFALLRRRSLMGDALAHAALPGVAVAYLLTGSKHIGLFLLGAAVAGVLGTMAITAITRYSKIKEDAAMGMVLTVFFGLGIMLLTVIQKSPRGNQSGLDKFLFGQAAAMVGLDVQVMAVIAGVLCLTVFLFFKELKLLAFDAGFGSGLGLPMGALDLLLNLMIVLAVVIGLQAVGVVLMAALLITPAVSARYWTDRLSAMVALSGLFGALSGALGTLLSQSAPKMPTGPLIVLAATALFIVSLLFAPRHGLVAKGLKLMRVRRHVAREGLLRAIYELAEEAGHAGLRVPGEELSRRKGLSAAALNLAASDLVREGLLAGAPAGWSLTEAGLRAALQVVREKRLWEVYLMHEGELGGQPVDRDGELSLPEGVRTQVEALLRVHGLEPKLTTVREGA